MSSPAASAERPVSSGIQQRHVWGRLAAALSQAEQRPRVCLEQIEAARHTTRSGTPYMVLKHRAAGTYLRLSEAEYALLPLMDGTRSVRELVVQYFLQHKVLAFPRVAGLVTRLWECGFLVERPTRCYPRLAAALHGRAAPLERGARWMLSWLLGREVLIDGLDPAVTALFRRGGHLLVSRPFVVASAGLAALGLSVFALGLASNSQRLFRVGDSYGLGFVVLVLSGLLATALHELGHALALKAVGRQVRRGGFAFYYGLPTFFVDTTDVWLAPPRARLLVSWAGPYTAFVLGGLASLGTVAVGPGPVGDVLFAWALVSYLDVLFNLNPLLELDGYYLLVDALERPLLRADAFAFVRGPFWRKVRQGVRLTHDERLLALYGLLAAAWSAFSVWLALFLWERRLAGFVAEIVRGGGPLGLLVLAVLASLAAAVLVAGLRGLERAIRPWVFRNSAILARKTRALRQRERLAVLRSLPFLQGVPQERLVEVAAVLQAKRVRAGEAVVRQGDVGDTFYLVHHGRLEVRREPEQTALATLGPGAYFGEIALLRHVPRTATVAALTACDLFAMRGTDFRSAIAHELATFQRISASVEARTELAALPLFEGLEPRELDLLLAKLEEHRFEPGQTVVRQGERGAHFYLVRSGTMAVEADGVTVNTLGRGDYFGEIALLRRVPRMATVRVAGNAPARLWSLGAADFRDVLGRYLGRAGELEDTGATRLRLLGMAG